MDLYSFFIQVTFLGFNEETDAAHIQVRSIYWTGKGHERLFETNFESMENLLISLKVTLNSSVIIPI